MSKAAATDMGVVVCLPTLNEVESIRKMIEMVRAESLNLWVVDAGSTDGTLEIATELGVPIYDRDFPGKGSGIQKALKLCAEQGIEKLVYIDCDLTYPVNKIPEMVALSKQYDLVIGARRMNDIVFSHKLANIFFNKLINLLFGGKFTDVHSGLRVLDVAKYNGLLTANNFDFEAQICCKTMKKGYSVYNLPIEYGERGGNSKVSFFHVFEILYRIFWERVTK